MNIEKRGESERTPQEIIDAMHRPAWCAETDAGRLYWELIGAAIRNDADALRERLGQGSEPRQTAVLVYSAGSLPRYGRAISTRQRVLWEALCTRRGGRINRHGPTTAATRQWPIISAMLSAPAWRRIFRCTRP